MIEWALRRKMYTERMVEAIMALYVDTRTRVKTVAGVSKDFDIEVGVHCAPRVYIKPIVVHCGDG